MEFDLYVPQDAGLVPRGYQSKILFRVRFHLVQPFVIVVAFTFQGIFCLCELTSIFLLALCHQQKVPEGTEVCCSFRSQHCDSAEMNALEELN